MRSLCSLAAILACLVRPSASQNDTSIAAPPDGADCFSNTTHIFEHLVDQPPFSSNTYILCPNTVFNIGYTNSQGECCDGGDLPLMARSNTRWQCGEDGSSANNCTIMGGTLQLLMTPLSFQEEEAANVVAQGLTFTKAGLATTPAALAGDLTYLDCIFEVRSAFNVLDPYWRRVSCTWLTLKVSLSTHAEHGKLGNRYRIV